MYFVYIIYNPYSNIYYKGVTQNLEKRIWEHNNQKSNFTSKFDSWELKYSLSFDNKREALIEEKRIKKLNRKSILALINIY